MSLGDLFAYFSRIGLYIVYKGDRYLITSNGRRFYRTDVFISAHAGLAWAEDVSYKQKHDKQVAHPS